MLIVLSLVGSASGLLIIAIYLFSSNKSSVVLWYVGGIFGGFCGMFASRLFGWSEPFHNSSDVKSMICSMILSIISLIGYFIFKKIIIRCSQNKE